MKDSDFHFQGREWCLAELCAAANIPCRVDRAPSIWINDVTSDSRDVRQGSMFVALAGSHVDGHDYVRQSVERGAAAVVVGRPVADVMIPQIVVGDTGMALGRLAANYYGVAGHALTLIGVTGTNGKSTTCALLQSIFRSAGRKTALLGTIEYDLVGRRAKAPWTTPPAVELCRLLAEARAGGADCVVMEVSSHALSQGRTAGLSFDAAVFTNLTQDHLDYHADFESYLSAKKRLFDSLVEGALAVVNGEDSSAFRVVADCSGRIERYGIGGGPWDYVGLIEEKGLSGTQFSMLRQGLVVEHLTTRLIGRHNVMNALAAVTVGLELGIDVESVRRGLSELDLVRGRLELVTSSDHPYSVFVDYAHTDDALSRVCSVLRSLTAGRLIVVFGCGGDRDRTKRPMMAAAVGRFAHVVVVTSDNPRSEDPSAIIDDMRPGFGHRPRCRVIIEKDRRRAIELAVVLAERGDTVLVAGKGHEDDQIVGEKRLLFDDAAVVCDAIEKSRSPKVQILRGDGITR